MTKESKEPAIVYVGQKKAMIYVTSIISQFNKGYEEVVLKARGRSIVKAIDSQQLAQRGFISDLKVKDIKLGTEELPRREGSGNIKISTIEIVLTI